MRAIAYIIICLTALCWAAGCDDDKQDAKDKINDYLSSDPTGEGDSDADPEEVPEEDRHSDTETVPLPEMSWGDPIALDIIDGDVDQDSLRVAPLGNGRFLALWRQSHEDGSYGLFSSEIFDGSAETTDLSDIGHGSPCLSGDGDGLAKMLWDEDSGIYTRTYTASDGWGDTPDLFTDDVCNPTHMSMSDDGDVVFLCAEILNLYGSDAGGIDTLVPGLTGTPTMGANREGAAAVALWIQHLTLDVMAARYNGTTWGAPEQISSTPFCENPAVAVDGRGRAVAIWEAKEEDVFMTSRFDGSRWSPEEQISTPDRGARNQASVALNNDGNGVAIWREDDWGEYNDQSALVAGHITPDGFGSPRIIERHWGGEPHVAVDSEGMAVAVWIRENGDLDELWGAYYSPGSGWSDPAAISTGGYVTKAQLTFDDDGTAAVLWKDSDDEVFAALLE